MKKTYDLIVIGTGDAGKEVAYPARKKGWKVAVIDKNPFGGTCGLRGCVPKKILVTGAELADFNRRMSEVGVKIGSPNIKWSQIQRLKKLSTDGTLKANIRGFKKAGIDAYRGAAHFVDKTTLRIGNNILTAKYFHIAAGSKPRSLNIPGEKFVKTSEDFLSLKDLPKNIIFVGGGYISFEFANIAVRAGSNATILHRSSQVLKQFDKDLVNILLKSSREVGINILTNAPTIKVGKENGKYSVYANINNKTKIFKSDLVFHGAGRVPDIDYLRLKMANIKSGTRGIIVNEYFQSVSNKQVFAAGDAAASGPPLTPVATREGKIVAENLINKGKIKKPDYTFTPSVAFTIPPLASVGFTESKAREKGFKFEIKFKETANWLHNSRVNEKFAGHKILIDKKTGKLLGAHIMGSHAEDLINIFAIAAQLGIKTKDLKKLFYAYPTASSSVQYMV